MSCSLRHLTLPTNGVRLHVVEAGPHGGPPVLLLHGFPEFWYGWRNQIGPLADAGFRVLAPDQRGYNLSDKPPSIADYSLDILAADVIGLMDAIGAEKASLVGHDWGAAVAWWISLRYPERLDRVALLDVPHPSVMRSHVRKSFGQMRRSWYILFFQLPWLPEALFRWNNWFLGTRSLTSTGRPGVFSESDLNEYRLAWSQPGAIRSMIHWYRAALRTPPDPPDYLRVRVPALLIWGGQEQFLEREMAHASIELCDDGRLVFIEKATHWVQHEEPDRVNALLLEFLSGGSR